jgi:hypothetical protein
MMTSRPLTLRSGNRSVAERPGKRAPRIGYAVASLVGIFAILGGQLGLSIILSDGAYRILSLERELVDRSRALDVISEDIGHMHDPQAVASLAVAMGMVQSGDASYLRLSDRAVIGASVPAGSNMASVIDIVPGEADIVEEVAVTLAASTPASDDQSADIPDLTLEQPANIVLDGVDVDPLPTLVQTNTPTKKFGGDLPAPTTR